MSFIVFQTRIVWKSHLPIILVVLVRIVLVRGGRMSCSPTAGSTLLTLTGVSWVILNV